MEKNYKNSSSKSVCEKFFKAVRNANPLRRSRRPSYQDQNPKPTSPASNLLSTTRIPHPPRTLHPQQNPHSTQVSRNNKANDDFVPVTIDFSSPPESNNPRKVHEGKAAAPKKKEIRGSGSDMNHMFSEYIDRVRNKMTRTVSSMGETDQLEMDNKDYNDKENSHHVDDMVTDYINRAGMKIRTTSSSFIAANSISSKSNGK